MHTLSDLRAIQRGVRGISEEKTVLPDLFSLLPVTIMPNIREKGTVFGGIVTAFPDGGLMKSSVKWAKTEFPGHNQSSSGQGAIMVRIRRCIGLVMLLALAAGLLGLSVAGAQTGNPGKAQKDAAKAAEQVPSDQPPAKTYEFQFSAAPWSQVLEWLRDLTGLPIITTIRPTGSLTFVPPKVDGKNKKYTVAEIIDVLNESLLEQKEVIIRRMASIMICAADEQLPLELVKSVSLDDVYGDLGKTEFVRVNYPLKALQAEPFAPGVKKMMGPFGQVIPLEEANQLILIDNVANLRIVIKMIKDIDNPDSQNTNWSKKCLYCRARRSRPEAPRHAWRSGQVGKGTRGH